MLCSVFIEARCFQYEQCCVCVRFYLRSNTQRCVNQELREEQADFSPPLLLLLFCQACELTKPKKSGEKPSPLPQTEKGGQGRRGRGWQQEACAPRRPQASLLGRKGCATRSKRNMARDTRKKKRSQHLPASSRQGFFYIFFLLSLLPLTTSPLPCRFLSLYSIYSLFFPFP